MKEKKVSESMAKAMENAEIIVRVNKAIEPMIKTGQVAGILARGARLANQMAHTNSFFKVAANAQKHLEVFTRTAKAIEAGKTAQNISRAANQMIEAQKCFERLSDKVNETLEETPSSIDFTIEGVRYTFSKGDVWQRVFGVMNFREILALDEVSIVACIKRFAERKRKLLSEPLQQFERDAVGQLESPAPDGKPESPQSVPLATDTLTVPQKALYFFYLQETGEMERFENMDGGKVKAIERLKEIGYIKSEKSFQQAYNEISKPNNRLRPNQAQNIEAVITQLTSEKAKARAADELKTIRARQ